MRLFVRAVPDDFRNLEWRRFLEFEDHGRNQDLTE